MSHIEDVSERIPRIGEVAWRRDDDGRIAIEKRKVGRVAGKILGWFGVRPTMTVRLDPLGSEVWHLIDGRSVGAILTALQAAHPDEDDLGPRLGQYLSTLVSNGMVRLD